MVTTREEIKHESVRIKRIVLDLQSVIFDSRMVVLFEYEEPLYLKLKTGRGVIQNMETICGTQSGTVCRISQMLENVRGPVTD